MSRGAHIRAIVLAAGLALAGGAAEARRLDVAPCDGGVGGMAAALGRSHLDTNRLVATRGMPVRPTGESQGPSPQALQQWFAARREATALILFAQDQGRHCAYLIDAKGLVAFGAGGDGSRADIEHALEAWRANADLPLEPRRGLRAAALDDAVLGPARPPRRTGAALASAAERLAAGIFPGQVRSRLAGYRHLVVQPYGSLGAVPYPALPTGEADRQLVDRATIVISPSLGDLRGATGGRTARAAPCGGGVSGKGALVIGDPLVSADPSYNFPPLPGARREAREAARRLGARPLIGAEATLAQARAAAAGAGLIWISAHGVADANAPLEGFVALADGRWTAGEIQKTCMPARLVVLSACQSGLGMSHDGGLAGLARAFQLAGVGQVAMSLWSVDDRSTEALMGDFLGGLQQDLRPEEALRRAMLERRKADRAPFHWASFAIFGA